MYRGADTVVFDVSDLLPYVSFHMDYFQKGIEVLNLGVVQFQLSCRTSEGLDAWQGWLVSQIKHK